MRFDCTGISRSVDLQYAIDVSVPRGLKELLYSFPIVLSPGIYDDPQCNENALCEGTCKDFCHVCNMHVTAKFMNGQSVMHDGMCQQYISACCYNMCTGQCGRRSLLERQEHVGGMIVSPG